MKLVGSERFETLNIINDKTRWNSVQRMGIGSIGDVTKSKTQKAT